MFFPRRLRPLDHLQRRHHDRCNPHHRSIRTPAIIRLRVLGLPRNPYIRLDPFHQLFRRQRHPTAPNRCADANPPAIAMPPHRKTPPRNTRLVHRYTITSIATLRSKMSFEREPRHRIGVLHVDCCSKCAINRRERGDGGHPALPPSQSPAASPLRGPMRGAARRPRLQNPR